MAADPMIPVLENPCPDCGGGGVTQSWPRRCETCGGTGRIPTADGQRILDLVTHGLMRSGPARSKDDVLEAFVRAVVEDVLNPDYA